MTRRAVRNKPSLSTADLVRVRGGTELPPPTLRPFPTDHDKNGEAVIDDDYLMDPTP